MAEVERITVPVLAEKKRAGQKISAITAYDAPRSYSYLILRSFPVGDHKGGTLTFTQSGTGTHVDWVTTYTIPARAGGKLMEAITQPLMRSVFGAILAGCAKRLEN